MVLYYVGGAKGAGKTMLVNEVDQRLKGNEDIVVVGASKEFSKLARGMFNKRIEDITEHERKKLRSNFIEMIVSIGNRVVILDSHYVDNRLGSFELLVPEKIKEITDVWCLIDNDEQHILRNRIRDYKSKKRDLSGRSIVVEVKKEQAAAMNLAKETGKELFVIKNSNLSEAVDRFTDIIAKTCGKAILSKIAFIRKADKNEVFASFLSYEYEERLTTDRLNECKTLLSDVDVSNLGDNDKRYELLRCIRGRMIQELPDKTAWYLVRTDLGTFTKFNAINYPTWNNLSEHTNVFRIAAQSLLNSNISIENSLRYEIINSKNKVYSIINNNKQCLDFRPIAVTRSMETIPTIIEGNHRAVALFATCGTLNKPIEMFLGVSKDFINYTWTVNK